MSADAWGIYRARVVVLQEGDLYVHIGFSGTQLPTCGLKIMSMGIDELIAPTAFAWNASPSTPA